MSGCRKNLSLLAIVYNFLMNCLEKVITIRLYYIKGNLLNMGSWKLSNHNLQSLLGYKGGFVWKD